LSGIQDVYLRFDLSTLPAGATGGAVQKATLKLWVNTVTTSGTFDTHRVSPSWNEEDITAANAPAPGALEVLGTSVTAVRSFVTVDLTNLVKELVDQDSTFLAVVLVPGAGGISVRFDSKENTGTSHEPRLEIVFSQPADISVRVMNSASISLPHQTWTTLTFDTETFDTDDIHCLPGQDPSDPTCAARPTARLTANTAGKYLIYAQVLFEDNPTGIRALRLMLNGTDNLVEIGKPGSSVTDGNGANFVTHFPLGVGDYVIVQAFQDSGGTLVVRSPGGVAFPVFGMVKLP